MRRRRRGHLTGGGLLAAALASSVLVGCLLVGNFDTTRCSTNADCAGRGLRNYQCREGNCLPGFPSNDDAARDATEEAVVAECTTRADCPGNASSIPTECVIGKCQEVQRNDVGCGYLAGLKAFKDPRTVLLGAYANSSTGGRYAIEFAVQEINAAGGLPSRTGPPRPLAVLVCNRDDPALMTAGAADHLFGTLRTPIVFGQIASAELTKLAPRAVMSDSVLLSTLGNDQTTRLLDGPSQARLWYLVDQLAAVAPIYKPTLALAEANARTRNGNAPITIGFVAAKGANTQALAAKLLDSNPATAILSFNGTDTPASSTFHRYPDIESKYYAKGTDYSGLVQSLFDARHSVIIGVADDELTQDIVLGVEKKYKASGITPAPFWILSPLNRYSAKDYTSILSQQNTFPSRVVGVDFSGDAAALKAFDARFATTLTSTLAADRAGFNVLYDATFVAAMAVAGAEDGARGTALVAVLPRALAANGTAVVVGPAPTAETNPFTILAGGGATKLSGTSGLFKVDPSTRSRAMGASLYCFSGSSELRYYDVSFDGSALSGAPSCF